ncbi:MAG: phospholipid-binding protein MlaC, partial [Burkholderiales bacterium]
MTAGKMHRLGALVLGCALALTSTAGLAQRAPEAVVKEVVDAAVAALKSERARQSGPIPIEAALAITRKSIVPHVDFDRITRDAAGRAWAGASAAQRSALTREFSTLLTHVVARLIATYEDEEFVVEAANPAKEPVVVRINVRQVRSPGESPMQPMFVSVHRAGQTWRIHELRAENVQIVRLYSANFAVVMERDGGMDGL